MEEHRDGERGRRERIFYKMCCSCIHILGSSPALWSSFTVLWILLTWSMGEKVKHLLRNSSAFKDVLFCFSQYILTICPELKSASVIRLNSGYSLNLQFVNVLVNCDPNFFKMHLKGYMDIFRWYHILHEFGIVFEWTQALKPLPRIEKVLKQARIQPSVTLL